MGQQETATRQAQAHCHKSQWGCKALCLCGNERREGRRKSRSRAEAHCRKEAEAELAMPKVGKRKFPYTKKGKAAAKKVAKKTGKKVRTTRKY